MFHVPAGILEVYVKFQQEDIPKSKYLTVEDIFDLEIRRSTFEETVKSAGIRRKLCAQLRTIQLVRKCEYRRRRCTFNRKYKYSTNISVY